MFNGGGPALWKVEVVYGDDWMILNACSSFEVYDCGVIQKPDTG